MGGCLPSGDQLIVMLMVPSVTSSSAEENANTFGSHCETNELTN